MGNDISLVDEEFKLNTRVAILIENEGRYLLENLDGYNYYNLPGGRVKFGETTKEAIVRELKEEIDLDISNNEIKLIVIAENLFEHKGFNYHEFDFVYYLNLDNSNKITKVKKIDGIDNVKQHLYWINKDEVKNYNCLPNFIYNLDSSKLTHVVIDEL